MTRRMKALLALMAMLAGFIAWDATREDPAAADLADAVPRGQRGPRADAEAEAGNTPGLPPGDTLPAGPRTAAAPSPMVTMDLFRPRRSATPEAPPPSEHDDPNQARVVGSAQRQGQWVALVEHGGQTHWLAPGQRVGGLRVDRATARGVQATDIARGTSQHLDLSPAGHIAGLQARPHDD